MKNKRFTRFLLLEKFISVILWAVWGLCFKFIYFSSDCRRLRAVRPTRRAPGSKTSLRLLYSSPVPLSALPSGGWSLKRRWRREERDGVNRTCPRCRCTVCLSSGRVCRRERCFWTWRATHCLRSSVRCWRCCSLSISAETHSATVH